MSEANDLVLDPDLGLTKRELFAVMALPALLTLGAEDPDSNLESIAKTAVDAADCLLDELKKLKLTEEESNNQTE